MDVVYAMLYAEQNGRAVPVTGATGRHRPRPEKKK